MMNALRNQSHSRLFRAFLIIGIIGIFIIFYQIHKKMTVPVITPGGSYTEGFVGAPRFINPILAQTITDRDITRLVFTPILNIQNQEIEYLLAESLEKNSSENSYTLVLRNDLYFSDGNRLDADDVLYTISQIQNPEIGSPLYQEWQGVTVTKVDNLTLEFKLSAAYQDFPYNLELGVLPEHLWSQTLGSDFIFEDLNIEPVGNGPFAVRSRSNETKHLSAEYELERNELALEEPYLEKIYLNFYENITNLEKALESGSIDAAYGVSNNLNNERIVTSVLPRSFGIFFNTKKENTVFTKEIRQALSYAIDRQSLVATVFNNQAVGHSQYNTYDASLETKYNPTQARTLIEEEGFTLGADNIYQKNNQTLSFTISIPNIENLVAVADSLQNSFSTLGVELSIETFDQGNFVQEVLRPRDYDAILYGYELLRPSDAYAFWHSSQANEPGLNVSVFELRELDTELKRLRENGDQNEASENIAKILNESHPAIILYSPLGRYVAPNHVKGMNISIEESQDRFNNIEQWYTKTRRMWPFFANEEI